MHARGIMLFINFLDAKDQVPSTNSETRCCFFNASRKDFKACAQSADPDKNQFQNCMNWLDLKAWVSGGLHSRYISGLSPPINLSFHEKKIEKQCIPVGKVEI